MIAYSMNDAPTRVLLIEDNVADSELVAQALASTTGPPFHLESVSRLAAGLERLAREVFEVVLLGFALPDGKGIVAFDRVFLAAPDALILILSSASDESAARLAVQGGADDYLVKAARPGDQFGQASPQAGCAALSRSGSFQTYQRLARAHDRRPVAAVERLTTCVQVSDTVCRQVGDEFVILLAEISRPHDATLVAEKLLAAFALPHVIGGLDLHITLSIGISVYPDDGDNV